MKLAEMEKYVSTRLQKTSNMTQQLAFHISACQIIADTLGSEFQTLQTMEKLMLDSRERKECLSYIERNMGIFFVFIFKLIYVMIKINDIKNCNEKYTPIDEHALRCLRLLCLLSVTSDGITQNELQNIQKLHLHTHGYQHIPLFYKLRTVGLLKYRTENLLHMLPNWNNEWSNNAQKLKLLPNHSKRSNSNDRTCPSYVFNNAYIPAIVRISFYITNSVVFNYDILTYCLMYYRRRY